MIAKKKQPRIYIAYGSNMDFEQMAHRCPKAKFIAIGYIENYELLFKGSQSGNYATIEKREGATVPVYLWQTTDADEKALDRYEGCPIFYYKTDIEVKLFGLRDIEVLGKKGKVKGYVYIMHEERLLGAPTARYYKVLQDGYERFGFDVKILKEGLKKSSV